MVLTDRSIPSADKCSDTDHADAGHASLKEGQSKREWSAILSVLSPLQMRWPW